MITKGILQILRSKYYDPLIKPELGLFIVGTPLYFYDIAYTPVLDYYHS